MPALRKSVTGSALVAFVLICMVHLVRYTAQPENHACRAAAGLHALCINAVYKYCMLGSAALARCGVESHEVGSKR